MSPTKSCRNGESNVVAVTESKQKKKTVTCPLTWWWNWNWLLLQFLSGSQLELTRDSQQHRVPVGGKGSLPSENPGWSTICWPKNRLKCLILNMMVGTRYCKNSDPSMRNVFVYYNLWWSVTPNKTGSHIETKWPVWARSALTEKHIRTLVSPFSVFFNSLCHLSPNNTRDELEKIKGVLVPPLHLPTLTGWSLKLECVARGAAFIP